MTVSETLSAYSTAAASNTPAGSDNIGPDLDDHLRNIKANLKTGWSHSDSENYPGRIWMDRSATPVIVAKYGDGTDNIPLFQIDESANTVYPYVGAVPMAAFGAGLAGDASTGSARTRLGLGALWGLDDTTASGMTRLGFSQVGKDIGTATNTAALLTVIGAPLSASAGLLVKAVTGSATSIAALPRMSGEFLTNIAAGNWRYSSGAVAVGTGTTKDITGINANGDVNEIVIGFSGVSTNSANQNLMVQLGDSGGIETSGYTGTVNGLGSGGSNSTNSAGFKLTEDQLYDAATVYDGAVTLTHLGGNVWACRHTGSDTSAVTWWGSGIKTLSDVLTQIRITTAGGSATFDAGNVYVVAR
jgi:hypothetical protein